MSEDLKSVDYVQHMPAEHLADLVATRPEYAARFIEVDPVVIQPKKSKPAPTPAPETN